MEPRYRFLLRANPKGDTCEGIAWHIRGILPDGSYYGEIRFDSPEQSKRRGAFIEGNIPLDDWKRCREIIAEISRHYIQKPGWNNAVITMEEEILFEYYLGDEKTSEAAQRFLELKKILEKEISKSYIKIQ